MPEGEKATPAPKRTMRTVTVAVMGLTAAVTAALMGSLRGEAAYALRSQTPAQLGILSDVDLAPHDGQYVRGYARLDGQPTLRFRRSFERDAYRVALAAPRGEPAGAQVWVVYGVPQALDGPRFVPPELVAGRLARVADLGVRYAGLEAAIAELGGRGDSWVVIDGEDPEGLGWLLGLEVLLGCFIGFNLLAIARVLRRIPPEATAAAPAAEAASG